MIPRGRPLRVVGDVHGDARAFAIAADTDHFVIQLGDLTDSGPDSAGALNIMLDLLQRRRGLFLLGNHDRKLGRVLAGKAVTMNPGLAATLDQLDDDLRRRTLDAIQAAPAWLVQGRRAFMHGGFHPSMLHRPPPPPLGRVEPPLARALFGQTTNRTQPDGYPERVLGWVDQIPDGMTCYVGHDWRSKDGRPFVWPGDGGGLAVFMDTGAGKGGHLSWLDLPPG